MWLKRICWVTLFGMRLQKNCKNSPTQPRIIQHKQGRDGVNNKARAHISAPPTTTYHPFSCPSCHPHPLPFFRSSLRQLFPLVHSRRLGNNIKRFSLQLCRRGNTWLSTGSFWPLSASAQVEFSLSADSSVQLRVNGCETPLHVNVLHLYSTFSSHSRPLKCF